MLLFFVGCPHLFGIEKPVVPPEYDKPPVFSFTEYLNHLESLESRLGNHDLISIRLLASGIEKKNYSPAIIKLFELRDYDYLELIWWRSADREKRMLIVGLFLWTYPKNSDFRMSTKWVPFKQYCKKFSSSESLFRLAEINYFEINTAPDLFLQWRNNLFEKTGLQKRGSPQNTDFPPE